MVILAGPISGVRPVCLQGNMAITEASLVETLREQEVLAQQIEGLDKAPGTEPGTEAVADEGVVGTEDCHETEASHAFPER